MNRNRTVTPRKKRMWTTDAFQISLTAGTGGPGSGILTNVTGEYTLGSGRMVGQGLTAAHVFLKGFLRNAAASSPIPFTVCSGLAVFSENIDALDMPKIAIHEGDWFLHDGRTVREPTGTQIFPQPEHLIGAFYDLESRAQRKLPRRDSRVFFYMEKDVSTENAVAFDFVVTILWLYE